MIAVDWNCNWQNSYILSYCNTDKDLRRGNKQYKVNLGEKKDEIVEEGLWRVVMKTKDLQKKSYGILRVAYSDILFLF